MNDLHIPQVVDPDEEPFHPFHLCYAKFSSYRFRNRAGFEPVPTSDTAVDHDVGVLAEEGKAIPNPPRIEMVPLRVQPNASATTQDDLRNGSTAAAAPPPMATSDNGQYHHPTTTGHRNHLERTTIGREPPDNSSTGKPFGAEEFTPTQSTAGLTILREANVGRGGRGRGEAEAFGSCCRRRFCKPGGLLAQSRIRALLCVYGIQSVRDALGTRYIR